MAFNMPAPFQKVGIRQRLYIAVGAIASFALVSAAAGWFALSRLDSAITVVTDEGVPTVIAALNLAERVADIAGVAPDLVTAQDEKEIQQLVAGIQQKEENIQKALDVISATMSGEGVETIEKETKTLLSSIGQLRQVVDARVRTTQFRIEETQKLTTIHGQFLQIAAPMVDDAVFELTSSMTSATSSGDMNKVSEALGKLANTELLMLQGITNLIAEVNNTVGLLAVGAQAANMDELQTISRRYELSAGKVERGLEFIEKVKSNKDLAKAAVAVLDFGSPGIGVISLREQELSALEQGRRALQASREAAQRLGAAAEKVVAEANQGVVGAATEAKQTSTGGKTILVAVAVASLLAAFLVGWLYIGRRIADPLTFLTAAMGRLANREWQTEVPDRNRGDEIGDMARAVQVFKENGLENEQLQQQVERNRRRGGRQGCRRRSVGPDRYPSAGRHDGAAGRARERLAGHGRRCL
jgi:phosphoglycerate-specific signal transduction histidine kinase